jgi:hypothetical protein
LVELCDYGFEFIDVGKGDPIPFLGCTADTVGNNQGVDFGAVGSTKLMIPIKVARVVGDLLQISLFLISIPLELDDKNRTRNEQDRIRPLHAVRKLVFQDSAVVRSAVHLLAEPSALSLQRRDRTSPSLDLLRGAGLNERCQGIDDFVEVGGTEMR